MELRNLGTTGLQVTRVGLGLAALGRPGYINLGHADDLDRSYEVDSMRQHAHSVLDAAWTAGVRYFDAARSYGEAEEFLGSWIAARNLANLDLTVGSKWGYSYTAGWQVDVPDDKKHEVKEHSLPVLNRQIRETLDLLGSQLNLYQIHSATLDSGVFDNADVLSRLAELRDGSLQDSDVAIGFSVSGAGQADSIRRGLEIERGGKPLFVTVQATWNILEQSAGDALAEAHAAGRGVIVKESLANGRLTSRNLDPEFRSRYESLFNVAAENETSIDAIAIACALRQPWADTVLSGAAAIDHLNSNLRSLEYCDHADLDAMLCLPESPDEYWAKRGQLAWN